MQKFNFEEISGILYDWLMDNVLVMDLIVRETETQFDDGCYTKDVKKEYWDQFTKSWTQCYDMAYTGLIINQLKGFFNNGLPIKKTTEEWLEEIEKWEHCEMKAPLIKGENNDKKDN